MRQTKLSIALIVALTSVLFSCRKDISVKDPSETTDEQGMCNNPTPPPPPAPVTYCGSATVPIYADSHTDNVGTVTIGNDGTNLYVTYNFTGTYKGKVTRLYVGSLAGIPLTSSGHANSADFPYKTNHYSEVTSFRYTIPLSSLTSTCYVVSAYAEVIKENGWGWTCYDETGWAEGTRFHTTCSNWSMYVNYCTVSCAPDTTPPDK